MPDASEYMSSATGKPATIRAMRTSHQHLWRRWRRSLSAHVVERADGHFRALVPAFGVVVATA